MRSQRCYRPDCRTVADIQKGVIKQVKRNRLSRFVYAKGDKETVAAWMMDLNRTLLIFNVRSAVFAWLSLTIRFQTELAINVYATVSDVRHDIANTHAIVSGVHHGIVNTQAIVSGLRQDIANAHTIVSDIHHTVVKGQEGTGGQNQPVSGACTPFITRKALTSV